MRLQAAPRIYCIPAAEAPVVAVFRRGPSRWSHVGRWDLERGRYEPGAWLRGRIFPRRSDLSPDGRWLCCFAHKPTASWEHGDAWVCVSRLPWLAALHAFGTCGTWTRGYAFTADAGALQPEAARLPIPWSLYPVRPEQFGVERRRGWVEAPDCPPRDPSDAWDERRNARMQKRQPAGERLLRVESLGRAGGEFGVDQAIDGLRVVYSLQFGADVERLEELQWADWDAQGHLLAATRSGRLQIRALDTAGSRLLFDEDLACLTPEPVAAPAWARHW